MFSQSTLKTANFKLLIIEKIKMYVVQLSI